MKLELLHERLASECLRHPVTMPYLPFRTTKWVNSAKVSTMSLTQRGIYAALLFGMWEEPTCSVQDDTFSLACAARVPFADFKGEWPTISNAFFDHQGRVFSERLCVERISLLKSMGYKIELDDLVEYFVGGETGRLLRPLRPKAPKKTMTYNLQLDLLGVDDFRLRQDNLGISVNDNDLSSDPQAKEKEKERTKEREKESVPILDSSGKNTDAGTEYGRATILSAPHEQAYLAIAIIIRDSIIESGSEARISDTRVRGWVRDIRLMVERDHRTRQQILDKIQEVYNDEFWKSVIRSAGTLRQRWNEGKLDRLGRNAVSRRSPRRIEHRSATDRERERGQYSERDGQLRLL